MPMSLAHAPLPDRLPSIAQARREWIDGDAPGNARIEPWIARSWQRCLAAGRRPQQRVVFDAVSRPAARAATERNRMLVAAARPVLERLSRAIAGTRYFAILTDADGIVVDVGPLADPAERGASAIARIGIDLSEHAVGTTAIGAALAERAPVWLHRGEHFFDDTSVYTCAGAPLFGPDGACIGMLDLTGVNVVERPELKHLAALSARGIDNALVLQQPHDLLVRLNWPGYGGQGGPGGYGGYGETDGLLCLDHDGHVTASNAAAREMLHQPLAPPPGRLHATDLFALPWTLLWDAARRGDDAAIEVPLWSGLRLQARAQRPGAAAAASPAPEARPRLRDVETALIRKAVDDARGNVAEAARVLGISRATVYRKLAHGTRPR